MSSPRPLNQKGETASKNDSENKDKWTATVENSNGLTLIFTAVDKDVIKDDEYPDYKRCDGMLTSFKSKKWEFEVI